MITVKGLSERIESHHQYEANAALEDSCTFSNGAKAKDDHGRAVIQVTKYVLESTHGAQGIIIGEADGCKDLACASSSPMLVTPSVIL